MDLPKREEINRAHEVHEEQVVVLFLQTVVSLSFQFQICLFLLLVFQTQSHQPFPSTLPCSILLLLIHCLAIHLHRCLAVAVAIHVHHDLLLVVQTTAEAIQHCVVCTSILSLQVIDADHHELQFRFQRHNLVTIALQQQLRCKRTRDGVDCAQRKHATM